MISWGFNHPTGELLFRHKVCVSHTDVHNCAKNVESKQKTMPNQNTLLLIVANFHPQTILSFCTRTFSTFRCCDRFFQDGWDRLANMPDETLDQTQHKNFDLDGGQFKYRFPCNLFMYPLTQKQTLRMMITTNETSMLMRPQISVIMLRAAGYSTNDMQMSSLAATSALTSTWIHDFFHSKFPLSELYVSWLHFNFLHTFSECGLNMHWIMKREAHVQNPRAKFSANLS